MNRCVPALLLLLLAASAPCGAQPGDPAWTELRPGLELGAFDLLRDGKPVRYPLRVLRIDPQLHELVLLSTSDPAQGQLHTAREWCLENGLLAAINASMYQTDYRRSVSLMRTRDHVNNPRLSKDKTVLAFDALDESVPPVQIIDRTCADFEAVSRRYGTLVQSIRMISCKGNNVWTQQKRRYSIAAIGIDKAGRVLMMHCRSPFSTHDLIERLLKLPLDLYNAMYVEGGPEAQLYVDAPGEESEFVGSFETGFFESDLNKKAWPIPNVIAVRPRAGALPDHERGGE